MARRSSSGLREHEADVDLPSLFILPNPPYPNSSVGKESTCKAGDPGLIPGSGKFPGEGKGYPLQYSGLKNSMACIVYGVTKSRTRLSNFRFHFKPPFHP